MSEVRFSERHPYRFVAQIELMVVLVYLAAGTLDHFVHLGNLGLYVVANVGLTLLTAAILTRMGWWRKAGFAVRLEPRDLRYFLVPLLPVVVNLLPGVRITGVAQVAGFLALALMVGFVEEGVFRGLMLRALEPKGVWHAVIVSTLVFSVTHLMNILAGESGWQAGFQLLYTFAIGFTFAALVLRDKPIWLVVVVHALMDYVVFLQDPSFTWPPAIEAGVDLAITAVFLAYGVFLLRGYRAGAAAGESSESADRLSA